MLNQRILITEAGKPSDLYLINESCRGLEANEVRVKVLATGVAFADIMMRKGRYPGAPSFPFTPGHEVVGTIDSIGSRVTTLQKGQMVAAFCKYGGYTRYINLPEKIIVPIPDDVSPLEAAATILNYTTAYQILHRVAQINEGDRILIHGAAGGVGTALLQLCQGKGYKVFGTASSKNKAKVMALGAHFIDYRNEDFVLRVKSETSGQGVDTVLDGVGGLNWKRSYQALKPDGLFVGYGFTYAAQKSIPTDEQQFMSLEWNKILTTNRTSTGHHGKIYSISQVEPSIISQDLKTLFQLLQSKEIIPRIAHVFPLIQAAEAHRLFESGSDGKILLLCND